MLSTANIRRPWGAVKRTAGASALLAGMVLASQAHAAYFIQINAGVGTCCGYEGSFVTASAALTTGQPATNGTGNTVDYSGTYGSYTQSTTNTANLTAGRVTADITAGRGGAASASASANMALGQVGAYAGAPGSGAGAGALSKFYTDFTVTNTTGADVLLPISWQVDGDPVAGTTSWTGVHSFLSVGFCCQRSSSDGQLDYQVDMFSQALTVQSENGTPFFTSHFHSTNLGGYSRLLSDVIDIPAGVTTGSIAGFLQLDCRSTSVCDYGHTGIFTLGNADGVSFNFDAPGFLSGPSGVPEPATWAMLLVGFAAVGAGLRRHRATLLASA